MEGIKDPTTFWIVQIENTAFCNRKCPWCPQSNLTFTPDQKMNWETLELIVENLVDLHYQNRIHPYGNGEPLTDDGFLEKVKFIRKRLPEAWMYISTNGDLVDKRYTFKEMLNAGLNYIQCNHYDDKNELLKRKYYLNVEHLDIGLLRNHFYNRAGNIKLTNISPSESCWFPGKKLYFNYHGDMLLCCSDWQFKYPIGNIKLNRIEDMLKSPKMQKAQDNLCPECNLIKH